ncbi:hypothetical protein [Methanosarcina sp. 1.H.A.2.2]|uniref:hypothetical protein n=1 Tax=Methanosarcina sp. 1.H.A.2.2 TaxID=1483601 RepID=UPI000ADDE4F7|nr:hypothetical protein [Methanosarcina sp. 1.H.A.2.2]
MLKKWFAVLVILICAIFAASSGCSENNAEDTNVPEESVELSNEENSAEDAGEEEVEVEMVSTGDSSDWCSVGSSWKSTNPQTGEEVTMKITGIETVDGVPMCKAVFETNLEDEDSSKIEYLWSEDGETYFWTAYDKSGEIVSEMSMKDGKMKIVDEEGNVIESSQGQ